MNKLSQIVFIIVADLFVYVPQALENLVHVYCAVQHKTAVD